MLAPGELLLKPPDEPPTKPAAQPPAGRPGEPQRPPVPTTARDEDNPSSFLMILLRALGAVHT